MIGCCALSAVTVAGACDSVAEAPCELDHLELQPTKRFPVGDTFWLPVPSGGCSTRPWKIERRPAGSGAAIIMGADGYPRFTPDLPGQWRFRLDGTDERIELTARAWSPEGFENFNYYPSSSVASVRDEVWTANPWDASITRLSAGEVLGRIDVGPWPVAIAWAEGMEVALVAQRGNDTVGFVDVASGRLLDAVWVGDEPANIALTSGGKTAFVALATEDAIAVVDVASRAVTRRIGLVKDPLAMALDEGRRTLWVASFRSGRPDRSPYGADPLADEKDVAAIDLDTFEVRYLIDVGHTITALLPNEDGSRLYLAHTRGDPAARLDEPEPGTAAFRHEVLVLAPRDGEALAVADIARQPTSAGPAVMLRDLALFAGSLWVTSEATDQVIALDPTTLEEVARHDAPGRPRDLAVIDGALYVHGAQRWTLTRLDSDGSRQDWSTGVESRPELVAAGQRFFTGIGRGYGEDRACNACHADGLSDTLVWKSGPFFSRHVARQLFWLEATTPLGWDGYSTSPHNFAHSGPVNIGVKPTTAEALGLAAYLESLLPPPRANGRTRRDGSMTARAELGEAIFEEAGCLVCHGSAITTNRSLVEDGVTGGLTDVPSLVGIYRHVIWLQHGEASTLADAVDLAVDRFSTAPLTSDERALLTQYITELVPRDFALIASDPPRGTRVAAVDRPLRLIFSAPVLATADNLARVALLDGETPVPVAAHADGRYVVLTPDAALGHETRYAVVVGPGFESLDERVAVETRVSFDTAVAPVVGLAGDYRWIVDMPAPDFENGRFDLGRTLPISTPVVATPGEVNPELRFDFGDGLLYDTLAVIDGDTLVTAGVPVPAGTLLGDSRGLEGELVDTDGDGIADEVSGALTLTGPGFATEGVTWRLERPAATGGCVEGAAGDVPVTVQLDAGGPAIVDWDHDLGNALAIYVTDPGATLPVLPGQTVTDGAAYWAVTTVEFPDGFAGPATYGVTPAGAEDASVANGASEGGDPLEAGSCYQFSVTTNQFKTGMFTMRLPAAP